MRKRKFGNKKALVNCKVKNTKSGGLVQCLDKQLKLFVKSFRCDSSAARKALFDELGSFARSHSEQLFKKWPPLRKNHCVT